MNILMVHGVNTNEDLNPYAPWQTAVTAGLQAAGFSGTVDADPASNGLHYNDLFDKHDHDPVVYAEAVAELIASAAWHALVGPALVAPQVEALAQPTGGFFDAMRWTAGMVAQWVVEKDLRTDCRNLLAETIQKQAPDVILAHSLGSLLCYDLFANDPRGQTLFNGGIFVTLGSQIGNAFIKDRMWGGRVPPINVKMWYNLYNPSDPVFVSPIGSTAANFHQFIMHPAFGGALDLTAHDPTVGSGHPGYLDNSTTNANLWPALAGGSMALLIARNIRIARSVTALKMQAVRAAIS